MTKRKLRAKTKFVDGKTFIHPHISYRMSDNRRRWINRVNDFVRRGMTFREIAEVMDINQTMVSTYYYGMAYHCLSDKQLEELKLIPGAIKTVTETKTRIAQVGEVPDRINVLQPVYTSVSVHYFEENELTDSMAVPFEFRTIKFIPSSTGCNFGKRGNEHESFEYVDVVDVEITKSTLKTYSIIYLGACTTI